jgi:hypothetical protein
MTGHAGSKLAKPRALQSVWQSKSTIDFDVRCDPTMKELRPGARPNACQDGAAAQTATIENGFVYLPRKAPWLADYLHELTVSPNGRYDDQVDVTRVLRKSLAR